MNQKIKMIITGAAFIALSAILIGCSSDSVDDSASLEKTQDSFHSSAPDAIGRIEQAKKVLKDVSLELSAEDQDGIVSVSVMLNNPNRKPVTSTQIWLSFNTNDLKGKEVDTSASDFSMVAPYSNDFDIISGIVRLGRSNPEPVTSEKINVATVVFEKTGKGVTMLDVYDYRNDLSGHTSANMMLDGVPYNILKKPESPVLIINNKD